MSRARAILLALCTAAMAVTGMARAVETQLQLELPGNASLSAETGPEPASHLLAVGPWSGGRVQGLTVNGERTQRAWRLASLGHTTAQLSDMLARQLEDAGYRLLYRCDQTSCGGYDFRYATLGLPEPGMHVDLGDYRYIAATRATAKGPAYVSVMLSRSRNTGFVEITTISPPGEEAQAAGLAGSGPFTPAAPLAPGATDIAVALEGTGRAVLSDLDFKVGSSDLGPGEFASLAALAGYIAAHPGIRVALVGHTDASGALDGNIALSRRRAQSVRTRLIESYAVPAEQLDAEGAGYLAPIASNQSAEGRAANRRVEAVVVSVP